MTDKSMSIENTAYSDQRQNMFYEIEDYSWWFRHRIRIFGLLANKYLDRAVPLYDIGGSNGFNAKMLQEDGFDVSLIEPTPAACENALERGVYKIHNTSFQEFSGKIAQFLCLDVIEHIKDDSGFLAQLYAQMPQNGIGLISVPAFMSLWSSEDEVDGHYRRYSLRQFKELVANSGFQILFSSYSFCFLLLPIFVRRHLFEKMHVVHKVYERTAFENDLIYKKQMVNCSKMVGRLLNLFMEYEYHLIENDKPICCGSSIVCVVKKN